MIKRVLALALIFVLLPQATQAAISFIGSAEGSSSPNSDTTVDLSGLGLQEGDLVVVAGAVGDDDSANLDMATVTANYNEVADLFSNDTDDTNMGVWWKLMGASPDSDVVVNAVGGTDASLAVVVMVFRGVDQTTPMDVTPTTAEAQLNTADPNPPSINHNNPSGVWTVIAGASGHVLGGASTYTFPTGYTTGAIDRGHDDTNDITVGLGYRSSGVSDPEDPGTMNHSGTDSTTNSWTAATLALRPAVASAPTVSNSTGDSNVTNTSATMNGDTTATGGADATTRGFAWGTNATLSNGDTSTTTESGTFSTGVFSQNVINLRSNTTYYYRAYATNSAGTGYASAIESFVTTEVSATRRMMRLFEGFIFKLFNGKFIIHQQ